MQPVHVLAIITAKPGMRDKILEAFRANVPNVHAEDGCIVYVPTIDHPDAGGSRPSSATIPSSWSRPGRAWMRSRPMAPHPTWQPTPPRPAR